MPLPKGQFDYGSMPRFGLTPFANRFASNLKNPMLEIGGDVENTLKLTNLFDKLPRVKQMSDFHCVTTWSCTQQEWEGVRFKDLYHAIICPEAKPKDDASFVVLHSQDGYRVSMQLMDLLAEDVLIVDRLNGQPLSADHGAPLRLIAPAHYGYKNPKCINKISFLSDSSSYKTAAYSFMEHPRGRVAYEERGKYFPGWFLRYLYRPLIKSTVKLFAEKAAGNNRK